eukprot:m.193200 g.193200  ORF g.193200 m.193200 type:complete len:141 (+) comp14876_c1_seq2:2337-2759(+)
MLTSVPQITVRSIAPSLVVCPRGSSAEVGSTNSGGWRVFPNSRRGVVTVPTEVEPAMEPEVDPYEMGELDLMPATGCCCESELAKAIGDDAGSAPMASPVDAAGDDDMTSGCLCLVCEVWEAIEAYQRNNKCKVCCENPK